MIMRRFAVLLCAIAMQGCTSIVSNFKADLAEDLSAAILNSDDLEVVRSGTPAYLIMLDALLRSDPDNATLLSAAASLNAAYANAFVADVDRRRAFADKAFDFGLRSACVNIDWACNAVDMRFDEFERSVATIDDDQLPAAYSWATSWAGWIQAHSDDWAAIAQFGRIKTLMTRIMEIDESYDYGGPQLYLGVFETLLPPAQGGRPELGRMHFERAIELSGGDYLMAKVLFAERYGRLVFDRELHDRELNEVLQANPRIDGLTLVNLLAQEQARELLASADEYF